MADQNLIHALRYKSLRIAELKHELRTVREYLGAVSYGKLDQTLPGLPQTPAQIIAHADKVFEGANDDNNVTPIRG